MDPLEDRGVAGLIETTGLGRPSIVVVDLDRDVTRVAVRQEAAIYPASTIKVPIAMALAARVACGAERFDRTTLVAPENLTLDDEPSPFLAGERARLDDLMFAMVSRSDNVATNVLIDVLGRAEITTYCRSIGLRGTAVRRKLSGSLPLVVDPEATGRNAHPPGDAATLFARIARGEEPGSEAVFEALARQRWNDKLSPGLRPGDAFAHKTGETDEVSHDGGILRLADGRRFVVVVYTEVGANPESDARFAALGRALRDRL